MTEDKFDYDKLAKVYAKEAKRWANVEEIAIYDLESSIKKIVKKFFQDYSAEVYQFVGDGKAGLVEQLVFSFGVVDGEPIIRLQDGTNTRIDLPHFNLRLAILRSLFFPKITQAEALRIVDAIGSMLEEVRSEVIRSIPPS